jgi:hypothetical protein
LLLLQPANRRTGRRTLTINVDFNPKVCEEHNADPTGMGRSGRATGDELKLRPELLIFKWMVDT